MEINEVLRRVILRHIRILFLCTLLGALASMALFTSRTPVYRASARVALGGWDPNDATKAKTLVDSARSVANSDRVVRAAIASAKVHRSIADVAATISVSASGSTSVVDVAVTDSDPKVAAKLADGLATTMIAVRSDLIRGQIQSLVADVDKRMAAQIALVSKFEV